IKANNQRFKNKGVWRRDGIPHFNINHCLESLISRHQNLTPHLLPHSTHGLLMLFGGPDRLLIGGGGVACAGQI
ncbi:MAG: hypothetical protein VW124_19090, partial [Paracoccaceae bacterium]